MTLKEWLNEGDPLACEGQLDAADAGQMRDRLLAAAARRAQDEGLPRLAWRTAAVLAIGLALALVATRVTVPDAAPPPPPDPMQIAIESIGAPRELHFSTARGTRVIWLFDPTFEERR